MPWKRWDYAARLAGLDNNLRKYCVNGIKEGFHPGISSNANPVSARENHFVEPTVIPRVYEDILHGLKSGFLLGPFDPKSELARRTVISPIGTVARKFSEKIRVIHDLSHGHSINRSVNFYISKQESSITYISTKQLARTILSLGTGAYLWVIDMAEAYRRVLLHPNFHQFLGIKWDNLVYRFACLPFGLASSPKIYSYFAEVLRQIVVFSHGDLYFTGELISLMNYLDDFSAGSPDKKTAWKQFNIFQEWLQYLGVPTQPKKCICPTHIIKILGFIYNTINMTLSVPELKIKEFILSIEELLSSPRRCSKQLIAEVVGRLNWTATVIFGARALIRPLELLLQLRVRWEARTIRLSQAIIQDLIWWKQLLRSELNSIPLQFVAKSAQDGDIHVWTDAAGGQGLGFAAFSSLGDYFQVKWSDLDLGPDWNWEDIGRGELLAVVVAAVIWANKFRGKSVTFHCDNTSVVAWVIKRSTPADRPDLLALVRWLTFICFKIRFYFWIQWIPGDRNIEADNLSRFRKDPFTRIFSGRDIDEFIEPFFQKQPNLLNFQFIRSSALSVAQKCLSQKASFIFTSLNAE